MKEETLYYPMLVWKSSSGAPLRSEEFNAFWDAFDGLPDPIKDIVASPEMAKRMRSLERDGGLSRESMETMSAIIREYFVSGRDLAWLGNTLSAVLDAKEVSFVRAYIQKNILTIKPAPREKKEEIPAPNAVSLPLLDALAKYQRLSEQTVTEDRIAVKGESQPVRGSIRNWLRHYRDTVGIRKHSTLERGQFLFQGENTRKLSAEDRERVSFLLKALDDGSSVSIDIDRQEILFPAFEGKKVAPSPFASGNPTPSLDTSFRPLEKFPAQAAPIQKALEWSAPDKKNENQNQGLRKPSFGFPLKEFSLSQKNPLENGLSNLSSHFQNTPPSGVSAPVYGSAPSGLSVPPQKPEPPFLSGGNMSFTSSHVLPHEKAQIESRDSESKSVSPSSNALSDRERKKPDAISVIRPHAGTLGARLLEGKESAMPSGSGSDSPRVVNLRGS